MPPQTQLVDKLGNVYTMTGGAIYVNGVADGYTANVTEVAWDGTDVWQYNGSQWYYQSAPCPGCSPGQAGAWIFSATGPTCSGPAPTQTATASATATQSSSATATATLTPTATATRTSTATATATSGTPIPTATATAGGGIPVAVVSSTVAISSVNRIGVNMGAQSLFSDANYMQNMFDDPGFEPPTDGHLIVVNSGASSSSFSDSADSGAATGFWVGALASVRTGSAAGTTFTITGFNSGGSYTFGTCQNASGGSISCPSLAKGVAVTEVLTSTSIQGNIATNVIGGWAANDAESALSTADAYEGQGSLAINVSSGSGHAVHYGWDYFVTTGGVCSDDNVTPCTIANESVDCGGSGSCLVAPQAGPWHPLVGAYELAFYARGTNSSTGTPQVAVSLIRGGGTNLSHTFTLTNDGNWHQYVYPFTGTDTAASAQNPLVFTLTGTNNTAESGATIYIDDIYLGKTTNSATGFRDEVVQTLQAINPGSLRFMSPANLGTSDAGLDGASGCTPGGSTPDAPGSCDFLHGPSYLNGGDGLWAYAASDLYPLAAKLGAVPWFSIGNTFTDADLKKFINNACTALTTYNFPSIWIEQSNEEWNTTTPSRNIKYGPGNYGQLGYGEEAGRNFSIMSAQAASQCPSYANRIHYVVGNQICNGGLIYGALSGASAAGYAIPNTSQYGTDDAPYYPGSGSLPLPTDSGTDAAQAAAYAAAFFSFIPTAVGPPGTGCINNGPYSDMWYIGSNNTISFYETGPNAYAGPGTTEQAYLSEAGFPSAAWMADSWLLGQQELRIPIQNEFVLSQAEFGVGGSAATNAPIWGITHDLNSDFGPKFPHLRPIAMGEEVVNSAIGGAYYPVNAPSGTVINAYQNAGAWSAALVNTTAAPITLTVQFPSSGALPQTAEAVLNTNGLSDNAENSNDVFVGPLPGGLSTSGQNVTLTLPAYSVVAIH